VQHPPSRGLLDLLPAAHRQSPDLGLFLAAFEAILFRPRDEANADAATNTVPGRAEQSRSLEQQIDAIPLLIDPLKTDDECLDWLAQWAAVTLYREAPDRRRVVAEMTPLYRTRGTRDYMERVLGLYVDGRISVEEDDLPGMAVGMPDRARVGVETRLGEDPFRFSVSIEFGAIPESRQARSNLVALARKVIELAKPAHTYYRLTHNLPEERGLVISIRSAIGVNTVLDRRESRAPRASRSYERHAR